MEDKKEIKLFRTALLRWFETNKRDFPWRKNVISNYELIFSEILLQRTKAETVSKYYHTFFNKYPDWTSLIEASLEDFVQIFKPLGLYNERAIRVYKICQEYKEKNGILPKNVDELHDSSFSSPYTSNAYELLILKKRAALIDVNMERVLGRFFFQEELKGVKKDKLIRELAFDVINIKSCKELNWAILDYAALVCKALKPKCMDCKLKGRCNYFANTRNDAIENRG